VRGKLVQSWSGRRDRWRARRTPQWGLRLAVGVLALIVAGAAFAPLVAPYNPDSQDLQARFAGPSLRHLFGTDGLGRDVFSRMVWGGRSAFEGVIIAIAVSVVIGIPWGVAAGEWPRVVGPVLMRLVDSMMSFPALILAIVVTAIVGPSLVSSMVAVGIVFSPVLARLARIGVLEYRTKGYVDSAILSGCPRRIIVFRHILPFAIAPVVVQVTIFTGLAFIVEGALSFLGMGIQPPTANWGGDLAIAYQNILESPGQIVAPGLMIAVTVLCIYRIGDYVRDRLSSALDSLPAAESSTVSGVAA
jgi:peptide/nickel transport system permease protein